MISIYVWIAKNMFVVDTGKNYWSYPLVCIKRAFVFHHVLNFGHFSLINAIICPILLTKRGLECVKNVIKKIRKQSNMTQEKLSKLCGVARQTINSVENDKYDPTLELAFKISRALDKNVEEVFIYDEIS